MDKVSKGALVYKEKLYPFLITTRSWRDTVAIGVNGMRICGVLVLIALSSMVQQEISGKAINNPYVAIIPYVLGPFAAALIFSFTELLYMNKTLSSNPLAIYSNGLDIPPIYLRKYTRRKGFIEKEKMAYIEIIRRKLFEASFGNGDAFGWHEAPVEFIVHLKNGRRRASGMRPPETIKEAVDIINKEWDISVFQKGTGNGYVNIIKGHRFVERKDL